MLLRNAEIPWATLAALILAFLFAAIILQTVDFPLGVLGDEWRKLEAIRDGRYYFHHPLFMIRAGELSNFLFAGGDLQSAVESARYCSAVAGGVLVLATYLLARTALPAWPSLAAAAAVAATPLVSTHARIFKEDIFVAPFLVLGLLALIKLIEAPSPRRTVLLGLCAGLAMSSKYIGALLLPFAVAAILFIPAAKPERRLLRAGTVTGIALLVLFFVELPAFSHLARARAGLSFELNHVVTGHDVALPIWKTFGLFHLSESLLIGLGPALTLLGMLGLAAPVLASPERRLPLGLIAAFAVLWYAVHELTPLKPYPDYSRYMLVLAPLLSVLAAASLYEILARRDRHGFASAAILVAAALPALVTSISINEGGPDPRGTVPSLLKASERRVVSDRYVEYIAGASPILGLKVKPTAAQADLVATANLTYDRFDTEAARREPASEGAAAFYDDLFKLPYVEISNGRPTYAYFNPVLRVVAMSGDVEMLDNIASAADKAGFKVRVVEPARRGFASLITVTR